MTVSIANESAFPLRAVRSYVLRQGRMTVAQKRALVDLWPRYGLELDAGRIDLDQLFPGKGQRLLEIGFGSGDHLLDLAAQEPESGFLGVDVHRPGVGRLLLQLEAKGLNNVRVFCADALDVLQHAIGPESLNTVLLLFPDPWPKKRHEKRRLVQNPFVRLVTSRLRHGGRFVVATDWEPYAEQIMSLLEADPDLTNCHGERRFAKIDHRPTTRFERRGVQLGHRIWDLEFVKQH